VAVSVHEGNTADSPPSAAVHKLREDSALSAWSWLAIGYGLAEGHRRDAQADGHRLDHGLKSASIRALLEQGHLQMDLFDERKSARV